MKKRIKSREIAVHVAYQMDIREDYDYKKMVANYRTELDNKYIDDVFKFMIDNLDAIDKLIASYLKEWKLDRISKLELAILRVAITEINYIEYIAFKTSVDEAVKLSKKYMDIKSSKFINGILKNFSPA